MLKQKTIEKLNNIKSPLNINNMFNMLISDTNTTSKSINDFSLYLKNNINIINDEIVKLNDTKNKYENMINVLTNKLTNNSVQFKCIITREFPNYNITRIQIKDENEYDMVIINLKNIPSKQIKINNNGTNTISFNSIRQKIIKEIYKINYIPSSDYNVDNLIYIGTNTGIIRN